MPIAECPVSEGRALSGLMSGKLFRPEVSKWSLSWMSKQVTNTLFGSPTVIVNLETPVLGESRRACPFPPGNLHSSSSMKSLINSFKKPPWLTISTSATLWWLLSPSSKLLLLPELILEKVECRCSSNGDSDTFGQPYLVNFGQGMLLRTSASDTGTVNGES